MVDKDFIEKARQYQKDIYGDYGPYIYVPMPESTNLSVPATMGCSYDKCLYCDLNHNIDFKILSLEKIEDNLKKLTFINQKNRRKIDKAVLIGGNPFVLTSEYLIDISNLITKYFPHIKYISSFARVEDILNKSKEELSLLKKYKYNNLSLGIESGSDKVLDFHKKASSSRDNLNAMLKLESLDINYSTYIMLGLGGKEYSSIHIEETGKLLNKVKPFELTIVTMVLFKDAPLVEEVKNKNFRRLSPLASLKELYKLLDLLDMDNTIFNATHKTNILPIKGILPQHKEIMLDKISQNIEELRVKDLGRYEHNRWNKWSTE